jgi:hypothetical protein
MTASAMKTGTILEKPAAKAKIIPGSSRIIIKKTAIIKRSRRK